MRILDFGKCNPFGTAKAGERFAKELRKGGSWELLFSTTFIYIYTHISHGNVYNSIQRNVRQCNSTYRHVLYVMDGWKDGCMDAQILGCLNASLFACFYVCVSVLAASVRLFVCM